MRFNARRLSTVLIAGSLGALPAGRRPALADEPASKPSPAAWIQVGERDLQKTIDDAAPNSTLACDPNRHMVLSAPIRIDKAITLKGLNARLPEKLGKTSLVIVTAPGVAITDFELTGNGDTVSQEER